jgi:CheY-like chemotaxis protein
MQIAANKQVDIIIVNTIYWGKYREVDWIKNIQMLKSNPETAQIPVILKLTGQVMVGDRERYLLESGADDAIRVNPGSYNSIVEKIKHTLSADDSTLNTRIN